MFENRKYLMSMGTGEATAPTTGHTGKHWATPMGSQQPSPAAGKQRAYWTPYIHVSSLPHWDATSPSKSESTLAYRAHCMGAGAEKLSGTGWKARGWYRTQCQSHTKLPGAPAPGCSYSATNAPIW